MVANTRFSLPALAFCVDLILGASARDSLAEGMTASLPPRPNYTCYRTSTPPKIDGQLNDDCWEQAETITKLVTVDTLRPARHASRIMLLWDEDCIYVAFRFEDDDIRCACEKRDEIRLCSEEFAEVMFDGDMSEDRYMEYAISPTDLHVDYYLFFLKDQPSARKWDASWETTGVRHAVHVDGTVNNPADRDKFWSTEWAIPYKGNIIDARNVPPKEGDQWLMNVFRLDRHGELKGDEWLAWAPTGKLDFNVASLFGFLRFAVRPNGERGK